MLRKSTMKTKLATILRKLIACERNDARNCYCIELHCEFGDWSYTGAGGLSGSGVDGGGGDYVVDHSRLAVAASDPR